MASTKKATARAKKAPAKAKKRKTAKRAAIAETLERAKAGKKLDGMDVMRLDGMKVPSNRERKSARGAAKKSPHYEKTKTAVLRAFRMIYGKEESEAKVLAIDPNDFDLDPSMFYEMLQDGFGVPPDPSNDYFGGYGGTVADTIAFLAARWDGKPRR